MGISRRIPHSNNRRKTRRGHLRYQHGGQKPEDAVFDYLRFPKISYKDKFVLVTGGAGFIGSNLVDALLAAGAEKVRVLDNLEMGRDKLVTNLSTATGFGPDKFEFMEGDIRKPEDCARACQGMNIVFHEAAMVSVPESVRNPMKNHDTNITGTLNMLRAAAAAEVQRFVFASSAATYGSLPGLPKEETQPRHYPSPYALSKGVDEDYAALWASMPALGNNMTCIGLRYFNVYGPRQDPTSVYSGVISKFADAINTNGTITFFGRGEQTRDFVFVGDIVFANLLAGLHKLPADMPSRIYNVGTGDATSLMDLKRDMESIVNKKAKFIFDDYRAGNIMHSVSSIDRIKAEMGYEPIFSLKAGLRYLLKPAE
jgi:nucleoside-diphosphate-sugar epimerase